jgi:hypothetical protein
MSRNDSVAATASPEEMERLRAAEEVCWHIILGMHLGLEADPILRGCDELQTWANLATRDGILHEDDPEGQEVAHTVPFPHGEVLPGYAA